MRTIPILGPFEGLVRVRFWCCCFLIALRALSHHVKDSALIFVSFCLIVQSFSRLVFRLIRRRFVAQQDQRDQHC